VSSKKKRILEVKRIVNCLLENGAYSVKNEQQQMVKKGDNYNPQEKILVKMSWKYRRYLGIQAQRDLIEMYRNDDDFLDFVEGEDGDLLKMFKSMVEVNERIDA
jgi:hypothetical protein